MTNTGGEDFTPHVMTLYKGEDVAGKILSLALNGTRGVCVLSATGFISNATIRQPGGIQIYEGCFEILTLTGSFAVSDNGGIKSRTGELSVSLARPDGRVIGGGVAGALIAAGPIQIVLGSYKTNTDKMMQEIENSVETEKYLPPEIIRQIMSWTPAKSLLRFKCVSKWLHKTIEDRSFVQMYSSHYEKCFLCKMQTSAENSEDEIFCFCSVKDGLILERSHSGNAYRIKNPLTKHVLVLPNPLEQHLYMSLNYSFAAKKYKLFYIYKKEGTQSGGCKFLTLDIDLNWRDVEAPGLQEGTSEKMNVISLKGGVYFMLKLDCRQVVRFEFESETSSVVGSIPQDCNISDAESISTFCCDNKYAIANVVHNAAGGEWKLDIWVLEDYKENKWDQRKISIPQPFMSKYLPQATQMRVAFVMRQWLAFDLNNGNHFVVCDIVDRNAKPWIRNVPPGLSIICFFRASMTHLQGMIAAEETDKQTSDYHLEMLHSRQ